MKFVSSKDVIKVIKNNSTIAVSGFAGVSVPEELLVKLEERFLSEKEPRNLTFMFAAAQGDGKSRGLNHIAYQTLIKRVIGGHFNLAPKLAKLMIEDKIQGYNFPQGIMCDIFRNTAKGESETISKIGLNTFVDPRVEGGKVNKSSKEDLVELININGQNKLLYHNTNIDIAFIKASYSDSEGNISMENEATYSEAFIIAQACKNSNGIVIVQVDNILEFIECSKVKIPSIYVDYVVCTNDKEHSGQILGEKFNKLLCTNCNYDNSSDNLKKYIERKKSFNRIEYELTPKKIIGRRATFEIKDKSIVNIGIGTPEEVSNAAIEYNLFDKMTLTVEPGAIGGIPQSKELFGSSIYPQCIIDQGSQFDFYDGGGIDIAFLGMAEVDKYGNVNVSKFGKRLAGCGGFINISQNARKVVFCGTFTVKNLIIEVVHGKVSIIHEGEKKKFINAVNQITFSYKNAMKNNIDIIYITERCVFKLKEDGLHLIEIAPGIDIDNHILRFMEFIPKIDDDLKVMDERIFEI